jgi:biotin carboxyl carrier protein
LRQDGDATRVALDADEREARVRRVGPGTFAITLDGRRADWDYARDGDALWLAHGGAAHRLAHPPVDAAADAAQNGVLRAPMPGAVLTVLAEVGRAVGAGDPLVVMESMKMELTIAATGDGVVTALWVAPGDRVGVDQPLAQVDAV